MTGKRLDGMPSQAGHSAICNGYRPGRLGVPRLSREWSSRAGRWRITFSISVPPRRLQPACSGPAAVRLQARV
jgi:hypothetical protein